MAVIRQQGIQNNHWQQLRTPQVSTPIDLGIEGLPTPAATTSDIEYQGRIYTPQLPASIRSQIECISIKPGEEPTIDGQGARFNVVLKFAGKDHPISEVRFDNLPAHIKTTDSSRKMAFAA